MVNEGARKNTVSVMFVIVHHGLLARAKNNIYGQAIHVGILGAIAKPRQRTTLVSIRNGIQPRNGRQAEIGICKNPLLSNAIMATIQQAIHHTISG